MGAELITYADEKETKRYRVSPQDVAALEERARVWRALAQGQPDRLKVQARAVYALHLDFLRAGVFGLDYSRWLSRHSGLSYRACYLRVRLGLALAVTGDPAQSPAALLDELRRREQTPVEVEAWEEPPAPPRRRTPRRSRVKARRRPSRQAVRDLEDRARAWAKIGLRTRLHAEAQAARVMELRRDFQAVGVGRSFPRWLSRVTGLPLTSVRRYLRGLG